MSKLLPPHELQMINERMYNRKHIDSYIEQEITANPDMVVKIEQGIVLLNEWLNHSYYDSKNARLEQVKNLDLYPLIKDIFVGVAYCQIPELFTSVTAQLASRLKFSNKADGITTIAEIVAVLCQTDAFDIIKKDKFSSLMIQSRIPISDKVIRYVEQSNYLPPLVCEPEELTSNYQSVYLSHNDSLILGAGNHHDGDICLDVINSKNKVALSLDVDFLSAVEEEPTFEIDTVLKQQHWSKYKADSYKFYDLMVKQGNKFYLSNKVDKRGRSYAQGYHITTQGTAFKKAMIELADKEIVDGVPQ